MNTILGRLELIVNTHQTSNLGGVEMVSVPRDDLAAAVKTLRAFASEAARKSPLRKSFSAVEPDIAKLLKVER